MTANIATFAAGIITLVLVTWSFFVLHHFRTYAIQGDRVNRALMAAFAIGCAIFLAAGAVFFFRIEWSALGFELPINF